MPTPPRPSPARLAAAYAVTMLVLLVLDGLWLGVVASSFYARELGPLMTDSVRVVPAALYYVGYPAAIVYLALTPPPPSRLHALLRSAALGLAAFGVYDLTNLAILRGYSVTMTVVDMAWGTLASALGGSVAYRFVIERARER